MGQSTSTSVIDEIDPDNFLGIPHEVRLYLLEHVPPKERRILRQTCSRLYEDIDEYLGPLNCLNLSDKKSTHILDFYARTYFRKIEISESCLFDGFQNILYKPHMIKSIAVEYLGPNLGGIVDSKFLIELLQKSKGLHSLKLTGVIRGSIPREEGIICLPRLKHLDIQLSDEILHAVPSNWTTLVGDQWTITNPSGVEVALDIWSENQLALLNRLIVPKCNQMMLGLTFRRNTELEDFDELELAQATFNFIARHRTCRSWHILVQRSRWARPPQHSFYYRKVKVSNPNDVVKGPDRVQLPTGYIGMKILGYFSEVTAPTALEEHLGEFMKSLKGLEALSMSRHPLHWVLLTQIIWKNRETLKVLVFLGTSSKMTNRFDMISCCTSLKAVTFDVDFGTEQLPISLMPSANMVTNLVFLVIHGSCTVASSELITLPQLLNLKYLSLY